MLIGVLNYLNLSTYEYDKLNDIDNILNKLIKEIPILYNKEIVRINIHQLSHLITSDIKVWGPLWTNFSFIYESMNGVFISLIHGTQKVPKSAIYTLSYMQYNPLKSIHIEFKNPNVAALYNKLQENNKR